MASRAHIDISGMTFNNLEVLGLDESTPLGANGAYFMCRCKICGRVVRRRGYDIRAGRARNCGCVRAARKPYDGTNAEPYVPVKSDTNRKYGCIYCADRKTCRGREECKYAGTLDVYASYAAYDDDMRVLQGLPYKERGIADEQW